MGDFVKVAFPIAVLLVVIFWMFQPHHDSLYVEPHPDPVDLKEELTKELQKLEDAQNHNNAAAELEIRRNLVRIYEELGMRDEATKHCIEVAKANPSEIIDPYQLIFTSMPEYPSRMLAELKTGTVVLKYTVTAEGLVENIELVSGESEFAKSAIEWMKKVRYAPAIQDGMPIATHGVTRKVTYELEY